MPDTQHCSTFVGTDEFKAIYKMTSSDLSQVMEKLEINAQKYWILLKYE